MKNKARFLVYQTFIVCLLICSNLLIYSTANSQMLYGDNQAGNIRFGNQARSSLVDFSVGSLDDVNRLDNTQLSNLLGDVNQSGSVTAIDATITLQYVVGAAQLTDAQVNLADVSGNGTVSSLDASLILRRVVDTNYRFPRQDMSYPLAVTIQGEGSVDEAVISTKSEYQYGTAVRLTARADEGWKFSGWSGDISGTDTSVTITVDVAQNVTATFEEARMKLNLTKTGSGEVGVAPEKEYYMPGDSLQLIANPDYGYRFLNWTYGDSTYQNDTVNIVVGTTLDIGVKFEYGEWVPLGEEWDYPNNTTHSYFLNRNHPNYHLTLRSSADKEYDIFSEGHDPDPLRYLEIDYKLARNFYYDFNSDGLLDMIGYLFAFTIVDPYSSINGKYIFVDDVLGDAERSYGDIELRFGIFGPLGDFNSDGIIDLVIGGSEGHVLADGTHGKWALGKYITVNVDKTISHHTFSTYEYHHDAATGDIDNDGDTDILFFGHLNPPQPGPQNGLLDKPLLFKNDGTGGFVQADLSEFFKGYKQKHFFVGPHPIDTDSLKAYPILTSKLFDLDADGWLDLIVGYEHNKPNLDFSVGHPTSRVYWNQGNGVFDVDDFSELPNSYPPDKYSAIGNVTVLGFNFIDFDNDGDYDIVGSLSPGYKGYIIQIHENLGNRQFSDVTGSLMDDYDDFTDFPDSPASVKRPGNFYDPVILDIDGDGDLDILPHMAGGFGEGEFSIQIYWENRDGKFYRSY